MNEENYNETPQAKIRNKLSPFWMLSAIIKSGNIIDNDKLLKLAELCETNKKIILELLVQTEKK